MGIDLGLTHFAVLSDGTKVDAPRFCAAAAAKLRTVAAGPVPQAEGHAQPGKAAPQGRPRHARVADTRRDWQHKLSTTIIRENQAVYVEDLAVAGLARTRLAESVHDAGLVDVHRPCWSTRPRRYGRTFARVDRFSPRPGCARRAGRSTSKPLNVRTWTCPCGAVHDRDVNAAMQHPGRRTGGQPTTVELVSAGTPVPQPAVKREPAGSTA